MARSGAFLFPDKRKPYAYRKYISEGLGGLAKGEQESRIGYMKPQETKTTTQAIGP